jgi:hypothetical protein
MALACPLLAGSLRLQVTNLTSTPWRIWASASVQLADEGAPAAPADPAGLQVPALGTLQVHLGWEDGPGQARPLFHAESVDAADTLVWTMAPDRIPVGAFLWTLHLQQPSPELLLRPVADPILLPSLRPSTGNTLPAILPGEPDQGSANQGDSPSPFPPGWPSESSGSSGEGLGSAPAGKGRVLPVHATLEFETRGHSRRITILDAVRPPLAIRVPIQAQGTPGAVEEPCRWASEGEQRYINLVPGYRYFIKITQGSKFGRDPFISYSRVLVLSGPGGEPWNAASLVGSRDVSAEHGDPWRFRLRATDALPEFQEEGGGRRNCFVFGAVEAGVVHGVTSMPTPAQDGATEPLSHARNSVPPREVADQAPQANPREENVMTTITVRNHLRIDCFLVADGVRRMRNGGLLMDLEGGPLPGSVPWTKRTGHPETSRFLRIPAGRAVQLPVSRYCTWGTGKRQRVLHLEVPGGTTGATLLAVQGLRSINGPAVPWRWFLRDSSGREAALLPGLELAGRVLEIRPLEGRDDARATPGESKQPLEDEWEEVEATGVAPLAPPRNATAGADPRKDDASSSTQVPPPETTAGEGRVSAGVGKVRGRPLATLEFETRGDTRRITLLDVDRPPKLARRALQANGAPEASEEPGHWVAKGRLRHVDLVPGYRYSIQISARSHFARDPLRPVSRVLVLSGPGGEPWNAASLVGSANRSSGNSDAWRFRLRATDALPGFLEEEGGRRNHFVFGPVEAGAVHRVTSLPIDDREGTVVQASTSGKRARPEGAPDEVTRPSKRRNHTATEITERNHLGVPCCLRADGVTRRPYTGILMDLEDRHVHGKAPWMTQAGHPDTTRFLTIPAGRTVLLQMRTHSRLGFNRGEFLMHLVVPGGTTGAALLARRTTGFVTGPEAPWTWILRETSGRETARLPGLELVGGKTLEIRPLEGQNEDKALPGESKDMEEGRRVVEEEAGAGPLAGNAPAQEANSGLMELALAATACQAVQDDRREGVE